VVRAARARLCFCVCVYMRSTPAMCCELSLSRGFLRSTVSCLCSRWSVEGGRKSIKKSGPCESGGPAPARKPAIGSRR